MLSTCRCSAKRILNERRTKTVSVSRINMSSRICSERECLALLSAFFPSLRSALASSRCVLAFSARFNFSLPRVQCTPMPACRPPPCIPCGRRKGDGIYRAQETFAFTGSRSHARSPDASPLAACLSRVCSASLSKAVKSSDGGRLSRKNTVSLRPATAGRLLYESISSVCVLSY